MGNHVIKFMFVFSFFVFLGSTSFAETNPPSTNKYKGKDCNSMGIPFNSLDYVEMKFSDRLARSGGRCTVVPGYSDGEAKKNCDGGYLINPGNPQYRKENGENPKNGLDKNAVGYYFCITQSSTSFNKEVMCNEMINADICKKYGIDIRFDKKPGREDGNCVCGKKGSLHKVDCAQANLAAIAAEEVTCDANIGQIKNPNQDTVTTIGACICDTSKGYRDDGRNGCIPPDKVATQAASGDISQALIDCVKGFEERAASCESAANKAKTTCDQKNPDNPEVNDALNATDLVSDMFQRQKAGSGMVAECVKAGALARSPKIILNALKEKCDTNFEECSKLCTDDEVQKYTQQCGDIANKTAEAEVSTKGITPNNNKNVIYYQERLAVIKKGQDTGAKICKEDASSTRSIFSDVLTGLGNAYMQGQRCACQMSATAFATAQSSCDTLPTAEQCLANPSLAGCAPVISVDICSPGSQNYSYQGCKCQQDPKAVGCPQYVAATPGLSGFAGADVGNSTGGAGATFGAGSGPTSALSPGDLNLNGNNAGDLASGNKSGALSAGFGGPVGASGAGGLGGVPGGGPEGGAGGASEDGEKGAGGAFGFVKSMAGALFGGGNKKNESGKGNGNAMGSKFDPSKYRPNRGLAQEYGVGNKNSELWQLMHDGYEMNQPTFIANP